MLLLAFIYQLRGRRDESLRVGIYPATAILLLAISGDSRYRKDSTFPVPGRHLARFGASKWVQRTAAVIVLAGGLAITIYAYWLNHGS